MAYDREGGVGFTGGVGISGIWWPIGYEVYMGEGLNMSLNVTV